MNKTAVILIGGRSGVGKSTVAFALHDLLVERDVKHALIEGDLLDLAHPAPWADHLAERNLAAMWANYRELGYRRLIYTNTVAVLEERALVNALSDETLVTSVLLRASDQTAAERLRRREHGESFELHLRRSATAASRLDISAPISAHRIETDGRQPIDLARQILALARWADSPESMDGPG